METKILGMDKKTAAGVTWLIQTVLGLGWILSIIALVTAKDELNLEEKRDYVSVVVVAALCMVLGWTFIIPVVGFVFSLIACIKAFKGEQWQIPGVYQLASLFVK